MRCRFVLLRALVVIPLLLSPCRGADEPSPEQVLRAAGVATDEASLLAFFRSRAPAPEVRRRADEAVRRLGADTYRARVQAAADLAAAGLHAVPALRRARLSPDPEVRRSAAQALVRICRKEAALCRAALALVGERGIQRAAPALIAFLPLAPDVATEEATLDALVALVDQDAKSAALVRAALGDPLPERRAPLALLCARAKGEAWRAAAVRLLDDADVQVRLRAVQGLVAAGDRRGLPVLIALLENGPAELVPVVRRMLADVAGATAVWNAVRGDPRQERRAWEEWYRAHGDDLDLKRPFGSERAYQDAEALRRFQERRRARLMRLELPPAMQEQLKQQAAAVEANVADAEQRMRQLWRPGPERLEATKDGISLLSRRRR